MLGNQISLTNNVAKHVISVIATTNGQQDFTVEGGYRINQLGVYRNGVRLVDGRDFTARDGATVRLVSQGAFAGDVMEFVVFDDFRVADALSVNAGGTVNASVNIVGSADQPNLTFDGSGQLKVGDSTVQLAIGRDNQNPFGSYLQAKASNGAARIISLNPVGGSVAIGTDNPLETLHVGTGAADAIRLGGTAFGYKMRANVSSTDDFGFFIEDKDGNDLYRVISASGTNTEVNTHRFYTANTERIRITATGRIEQKTNNEDIDMDSFANGQLKLDGNGYNVGFALNAQGLNIYNNSSSRGIIFGTDETERLRIASNGNVGIGTDSPDERLHIFTLADTPALEIEQGTIDRRAQIRFNSPEAGNGWLVGTIGGAEADHGHFIIYQQASTASNRHLRFYTNNVQHFNMDHVGRIDHFCTDSNGYDIHTSESGAADTAFAVKNAAGSIADGTQVMFIRADGDLENTNNAYGAISDAKLKENIVDASSQWNDIKSLQVRNYNFKESTGFSTHTQLGVVAQEIETISPGLVDDTPDLDNDGNDLGTVTKTVNYSVLYMKTVKALQEAMNRIETLESKVAALEGN